MRKPNMSINPRRLKTHQITAFIINKVSLCKKLNNLHKCKQEKS